MVYQHEDFEKMIILKSMYKHHNILPYKNFKADCKSMYMV